MSCGACTQGSKEDVDEVAIEVHEGLGMEAKILEANDPAMAQCKPPPCAPTPATTPPIDSETSYEWLTLTNKQARSLRKRVKNRASHDKTDAQEAQLRALANASLEEDAVEEGGARSHGHGEKPHSLANAVASALINFLLMFGLCCAYGMIMFSDPSSSRHVGLGIKMNLGTALVFGLLLSKFSGVAVGIGGPDLNPVVFLGGLIETISVAIADDLGLSSLNPGRRLGGASGGSTSGPLRCEPEWISAMNAGSDSGALSGDYGAACDKFHTQLRATAIFATAVSTAVFAAVFWLLGRFKLSRYVSFVPMSVQEAFLSCIGYKVFKYALKFCHYDLFQFIPAASIGVPLYFLKAYHIGSPTVMMPLGLLLPLGVFYAIIFGTGVGIDGAREAEWFFPVMENADWYSPWVDGFLKYDQININAWKSSLPDLFLMMVVIILDCMLKISSTEVKLPVKVDKDYELKLFGTGNVLTTLLGQSVGYMQLKFNVINYGVLGNVTDRRAGAIYALLCGICFFGTTDLINYLPRLFLGSLLFFAGAGFVCENLWGSRKYLRFEEWVEILVIVGIFVLTGQLLYAVGVGLLLTGVSFIRKYAAVPAVLGRPLRGSEVATHCVGVGVLAQRNFAHIADSWLLVTKLRGYVFFASVQRVTDRMMERIHAETSYPTYQRMKYAIFDCAHLDGLDVSAAKAFKKLIAEAGTAGVHVYFCSLSPSLVEDFFMREIILDESYLFSQLGEAMLFVETQIMLYCTRLQSMWMNLHPAFHVNLQVQLANEGFDPFHGVLTCDASRVNGPWRYCSRMPITKYSTVLWLNGEAHQNLYLVHGGSVGLFHELPDYDSVNGDDWSSPIKVCGHGAFLNVEALSRAQSKTCAVTLESGELVFWTQEQWWRMSREQPIMVRDILRAVMRQQTMESATGVQERKPQKELVNYASERSSVAFTPSVDMDESAGSMEGTVTLDMDEPAGSKEEPTSQWARQTSQWSSIVNPHSREQFRRQTSAPSAFVPTELEGILQELEAAASLADLGFFEPLSDDEVAEHPPLSATMQRDLHNAFVTYATRDTAASQPTSPMKGSRPGSPKRQFRPRSPKAGSSPGSPMAGSLPEPTLPYQSLEAALMYAGVFDSVLLFQEGHLTELTYAQFMEIAHFATMAKLSQKHLDIIHKIFQEFDFDGSNSLDPGELSQILHKTMHPRYDINVETVDGIAAAFAVDDEIDGPAFARVMSRYIKKHERRWLLLKGILDLTGKTYSEVRSTCIDCRALEEAANKHVNRERGALSSQDHISELLWAADWLRRGEGDGKTLTFEGLVAALSTLYAHPTLGLPPPPSEVGAVHVREVLPAHQKLTGFRAEDWMLDFRSSLVDTEAYTRMRGTRSMRSRTVVSLQDVQEEEEEEAEANTTFPETFKQVLYQLDSDNSVLRMGSHRTLAFRLVLQGTAEYMDAITLYKAAISRIRHYLRSENVKNKDSLIAKISVAKLELNSLLSMVEPFCNNVVPGLKEKAKGYSKKDTLESRIIRHYMIDIDGNMDQIISQCKAQIQVCETLIDEYERKAADRVNEILNFLTIITFLIMPMQILTGLYGMNFTHMPELHWKFGYHYFFGIALSFTALAALVLGCVYKAFT
mmetsp:Transcript_65921/g.169648  ORF Transcript_65921/g.169648 Transcript_65921/m.169648 type:complete len:1614 (-) Transcript_65921:40-4881(-)